MNLETGEYPTGRTPLILVDRRFSLNQAEVLYKSVTSRGEQLAPWLYRRLEDPEVAGVIIFGESGAGKTTLLSQVTKELLRMSQRMILPTLITSGEIVGLTEQQLTFSMREGRDFVGNPITPIGPEEKFDRGRWTLPIWDWTATNTAEMLKQAIEKSLKPDSHPLVSSRSKVVLADIAGIGERRARLAAHLGDVAKQCPENTLFLVAPGNPEIQDRAVRLRNTATRFLSGFLSVRGMPPAYIMDEYKLRHMKLTKKESWQIREVLAEEFITLDEDPLSALISIREGARPGRFEAIRDEFVEEVFDWARNDRNQQKADNAKLPEGFYIRNNIDRAIYALKVAYAEDYLERVFGIPPDSNQGRVILIPYLRETTIHQWIRLLRQF